MKAEIIAVGTEILLGDIVNTNSAFLARELAALGLDMHYQTVVGDNPEHIIAAANLAAKRSNVIIFTGGLGPTDDDLTREAVAAAFSLNLVTDEVTKRRIIEFFNCRHKQATDNNFKQAKVFEEGEVLQNDNGTAPGLYCRKDNRIIILLPGPPFELEPLFEKQVAPRLRKLSSSAIVSRTLRVFGIAESELEVKLGNALKTANPTAALYAKRAEVFVRVTAKADTEPLARTLCDARAREISALISDNVYCDDDRNLQQVAVELLKKQNKKLAVAESVTCGMLASAVADVAGASQIFEFGVDSYSDRVKAEMLGVSADAIKKNTAVCADVAASMAQGALLLSGADVAVSTTGWAGPDGDKVGLCYIAVADSARTVVRRIELGDKRDRETVRIHCTKNALDMLRRYLLGLEIPEGETRACSLTPARKKELLARWKEYFVVPRK